MIRIRYRNFISGPHGGTGLHGTAERCPRGVTVYLMPGLAGWQRSAVIRRLRQEASRGVGPELPLPELAVAIGADRVRAGARLAASVLRLHPLAALLPSAAVVAAMALFVLASAGGGPPRPAMAGSPHQPGGWPGAELRTTGSVVTSYVGLAGADVRSVVLRPSGPARPAAGQHGAARHGAAQREAAGQGGVGLGSGLRVTRRPRRRGPHVDRVCRGALPGIARPGRGQLACRRVSYTRHRPGPADLAS